MAKNTGIPYEKLVQYIYQQIVNCDSITTIDVKRDVKLQGKINTHQIDVYWEFSMGGIVYRTIVQAKDWQSKVPQKEMMTFHDILDDLPNGTKGIFITRTGFQSGAVKCAKGHGISIYTFRPPAEENWSKAIPTVNLEVRLRTPFCTQVQFHMPPDWAKEHSQAQGLLRGLGHESTVIDNETGRTCTVIQLIAEACETCGRPPRDYTKEFRDAYVQPYGTEDRIKVDAFSGIFGYQTKPGGTFRIRVDEVLGYILRDVTDGRIELFDHDATLLRNEVYHNG